MSRYWDRIYRPEQLITALPEVMRVLTSPSDCGAATLALPQDVQTEAFDYPEELFRKRVWLIRRGVPDKISFDRAVAAISASRRPLIVAGGGVLMSEASAALTAFVAKTGIPVGESQAGKGSLAWDHPQSMGAIGATGTLAANRLAAKADLVIGIGTRYADFTSASMTAFQNPDVRFVNINTAEFDAYKVGACLLYTSPRNLAEAKNGRRKIWLLFLKSQKAICTRKVTRHKETNPHALLTHSWIPSFEPGLKNAIQSRGS